MVKPTLRLVTHCAEAGAWLLKMILKGQETSFYGAQSRYTTPNRCVKRRHRAVYVQSRTFSADTRRDRPRQQRGFPGLRKMWHHFTSCGSPDGIRSLSANCVFGPVIQTVTASGPSPVAGVGGRTAT